MVSVVNSTGTVKPKLQVSVGSFVSGPITELHVEFNQEVKKDEMLAKIDPRIYDAAVARGQASLANREADVFRVQLSCSRQSTTKNGPSRSAKRTRHSSPRLRWDKFTFARLGLEAQLKVAETSVEQARATLQIRRSTAITPRSGPRRRIVINRKIDPGQTLAAQFQTPELFIIAPDMRNEMHIHANGDEADIGQIRSAQEKNHPVLVHRRCLSGTVHGQDPGDSVSSTTLQNVVTYPVVVTASNPDLKLLPGMTASLSFQVDERSAITKLPSAALRFYPTRSMSVRKTCRSWKDLFNPAPRLGGLWRATAISDCPSPHSTGPSPARNARSGTSGWPKVRSSEPFPSASGSLTVSSTNW